MGSEKRIRLSVRKKQLINGEIIKASDYLRKNIGHSIILMTGFLLISIYSGLHLVGLFPSLYTNKIPQTYIELINRAETGQETPENGTYRHEKYKKAYDEFLKEFAKTEKSRARLSFVVTHFPMYLNG